MQRSRRFASLVAFTALVAAAPLGAQVRINLAAWREPVLLDTLRQQHQLNAVPGPVYEAVLKAFADLGIPTGRTDGKAGIVGSERFERVNTLAGAPMSRSFSCGEGAAGPYADALRLEIAVVAWVASSETNGTTISFATIASGRDISGVFRAPRPCASTGALETKLLERVTKLVGG
jgi:hypothetical protein